jgi:hypothetical protein
VIAVDQKDPQYYVLARNMIGKSPSSLDLVLPEVDLDQQETLIPKIHKNQYYYLENHLEECDPGFVLVERTLSDGKTVRTGLMAVIKLDKYGRNESGSLIRATENTLPEKLATRKRIRRGAPMEIPHTINLYDDPDDIVLRGVTRTGKILYDFDLMMGAGHLRGTLINDEKSIESIANNFTILADPELQSRKYGLKGIKPVLSADGDGNHGNTSAKDIREEFKAELPDNHPLHGTLVELINIHNPGVQFKPINRIIAGNSPTDILDGMKAFYGSSTSVILCDSKEDAVNNVHFGQPGMHNIRFKYGEKHGVIRINPTHSLPVGTLQEFLEFYTDGNVNYVHGEANTDLLCSEKGKLGLYLPQFPKDEFFKTIIVHGILPKKAFSIGESDDKRFYLEARKLIF